MSEFDSKAHEWDKNKTHIERSQAIALELLNMVPVDHYKTAMEYGAGTGLLSFELKERFAEILLMDSSQEMVRVAQDKIANEGVKNMRALWIDLEEEEFTGEFDVIYNQMVLHHVGNIETIFQKFHEMLKPGGYLAVADLYTEDGSFHGDSFTGHKGFDIHVLIDILKRNNFTQFSHKKVFDVKRESANGEIREYPVFLLVAQRSL